MTELVIQKLERFPNRIDFIQSFPMIANDEIGQTPVKFDNVMDKNFRVSYGMNVHKGKTFSLHHTIQHNSNLLEDVHFWCTAVLFCGTKLFQSKIMSAHKMMIFYD